LTQHYLFTKIVIYRYKVYNIGPGYLGHKTA